MEKTAVQLATVNEVIDAPIADIWAVLTDFPHPQRLAPTIDHCISCGTGVGAIRTVKSSRGLTIHERLLECDSATGRYRYEVLDRGDMPFADILSYECTVIVSSRADGASLLHWSSVGIIDGPREPIADFLGGLYRRATENIRVAVSAKG